MGTLDFSLIWKTLLTILYGTLILRIAGRKSLAQMTVAQTVVMLAVGTVLIEPLVGAELIDTFVLVAVAVFTLIAIEYSEIRFPFLKKIFTGHPVVLIENGEMKRERLKQVRMTIQQLEMELRQASISKVSDVKWGTIEPNGRFGFILKDELQPVDRWEFERLLDRLANIEKSITNHSNEAFDAPPPAPIGNEIRDPHSEEDVFEKLVDNDKKTLGWAAFKK
ncbi:MULTISPECIES: DUF421 domain-containing protein [Pelosinus]|uniref:YetF C-terminal domain-containing protein n=1 Tax=Pelosinus fermentans B4 TaxID=1149862 RepID=I8RN11_9FIRM|nr:MULTISPECIES: YetF domain-containing protein [Pelosinus]EIW20340.1 protein of unknown function DUF421 [Pelosinus fermentans B4]EIW25601.1 protein of unknown function DUF421 [Pelosinus fermentans A11]OAM93323.1 protein of unknown function DUF421 [Pelosinus fermentans DSM 17108]SDQ73928.1 Protein of unknown function [Pelosinus fermentans]